VTSKPFSAAIAVLLAAAAPVALQAQATSDTTVNAAAVADQPEQIQEWFAEFQKIGAQLNEIQAKALQDAELNSAQSELGTTIQNAMEAADPELAGVMDRLKELDQAAQAAQAQSDTVALQKLAAEAQQIEGRFREAQAAALEQPEIAAKVESFQESLEAKMLAVNSETPALMQRYQELGSRIQSVLGQRGSE
jgi:chaperonin cofactor prefoldin